jgi:serine/threonine protein kinase
MGTEDTFNYMMMNLLGPSLETYIMNNGGKLELKLAINFGGQMLERIQHIHSRGFIHRDLRPEHFLYGREKWPNRLYLTGLSIGKKYLLIDKKHALYRDNKLSFTGTARFSSINTLLGIEQARRDDIEAIVYILIYLIKGYLPWQGIKAYDKKEKFEKILLAKMATPIEVLCRDLPEELAQILEQVRSLEYEEEPDYEDFRRKLSNASRGLKEDVIF